MQEHAHTAQRPSVRTGPRPLGLYYAMLMQHQAAGPNWQHWLAPQFQQQWQNLSSTDFLHGVQRYRENPWQRPQPEQHYQTRWQSGRVRLQDCGGTGSPILLIPSLINKAYIFDLLPGTSFVQHLQRHHHVYILDWSEPRPGQPALSIHSCVQDYILPALETLGGAHLLGYCMGGTLALLAAQAGQQHIYSLILAATPWDFSGLPLHHTLQALPLNPEALLELQPIIPVDLVQSPFFFIDPTATIHRLSAYATTTDPATLKRLTALEDWLGDGIPLEASIAGTILLDWYRDNRLLDDPLSNIHCPVLVVSATLDKIVPPHSSQPLLQKLPHATGLEVTSGHVGLLAGRNATTKFYAPVTEWLAGLA